MNNFGTKYSTFTIALRSKPTDTVSLAFSISDTNRATLLTPSLTFTETDWNTPQTVQVEGKSDGADGSAGDNGNIDYTLDFVATSTDTTYNATVTEPSFTIRSCDNDFGRLLQPCNYSGQPFGDSRSRHSAGEGTGTNTSQMWIIAKNNSGSTTVNTATTDTSEGTVPASVTVDATSYNMMEAAGNNRVVITHVNEFDLDGNQNFSITTSYGGGSVNYNPEDITGTTTDNEQLYYISRSGNTSEDMVTTATIYVCLGASPGSSVTLTPACSGDECGGTFTPTSITWNAGEVSNASSNATCNGSASNVKSFTINGANDAFADGTQTFSVNFGAGATSGDGTFSGQSPSSQTISNLDNEQPGKAVFVTSGTFNGEMTAAGVLGADANCSANRPGYAPSGTYKALIVGQGDTNTRLATTTGTDATGQTDWVLTANYHYYRCESGACSDEVSDLFIANASALFDPNAMSRDF